MKDERNLSLKTENFDTYMRLVVSFQTSNKKGYKWKNNWVGMGYLGFEVEGNQKS